MKFDPHSVLQLKQLKKQPEKNSGLPEFFSGCFLEENRNEFSRENQPLSEFASFKISHERWITSINLTHSWN